MRQGLWKGGIGMQTLIIWVYPGFPKTFGLMQ